LKKLILIGDSIRLHYQPYVVQALSSYIDVWGPAENCETSSVILHHLDQWVLAHNPDVIHLNCGLHDLRYNPGSTTPVVSVAQYAQNLNAILTMLTTQTRSQIIWATTTPINQVRHQIARQSRRYEADVLTYNMVACNIVANYNVLVNDLYTFVLTEGRDTLLREDGVHFTPHGYERLAQQVTRCVQPIAEEHA
jgi:lysophospholipase L1-like esterase